MILIILISALMLGITLVASAKPYENTDIVNYDYK